MRPDSAPSPLDDADAVLDDEIVGARFWRRGGGSGLGLPPLSSPRDEDLSSLTASELRNRLAQLQKQNMLHLPDGGRKAAARAAALREALAARERADAERAAAAAAAAATKRAAPDDDDDGDSGRAGRAARPAKERRRRDPTPPDRAASKHWFSAATAQAAGTDKRPRGGACCLCSASFVADQLAPLPGDRRVSDEVLSALAARAGVPKKDLRACRPCAAANLSGGTGGGGLRQTRLGGLGGWPPSLAAAADAARRGGRAPPPGDGDAVIVLDDDGAASPPAAAAAVGSTFTATGRRRSGRAGTPRGGSAVRYAGLSAAWPRGAARGAVSFGPADIACLDEDAMLNDTIIDLQMK